MTDHGSNAVVKRLGARRETSVQSECQQHHRWHERGDVFWFWFWMGFALDTLVTILNCLLTS